jgi:hypothetical protein
MIVRILARQYTPPGSPMFAMSCARLMARMLGLVVLFANCCVEAQWTQFRGPNGSGVEKNGTGYPVEFTPAKNVAWKAVVPYGQSSPVLRAGESTPDNAASCKCLASAWLLIMPSGRAALNA